MTLEQFLLQLGIGVTSNIIYAVLQKSITSGKNSFEDLKEEIAKQLLIDGASIKAKKIINFLAERGDISISNSIIHSNISILYSSGVNNKFSLKDNVSSSTDKSRIEIGKDALAEGSGGAFIHQDENGNITVGFK